jgi:predicted GNAT family N-acyltransferase
MMRLRTVSERTDRWKVFVVRGIVFVEEQGVPYDEEIDAFDDTAVHVLGEIDGEPVAAGRLRDVDGWAKLERIAVRRAWRGHGFGRQVVEYLLAEARRRGYRRFRLSAQAHLVDFYGAHGFVVDGPLFRECGIDHIPMIRDGRDSSTV